MKQIEMTNEQKEKLEFGLRTINKFSKWVDASRLEKVKKELKEELGIKTYQTLGEYVKSRECRAYHTFHCTLVFFGKEIPIEFSTTYDFVYHFGREQLGKYYVIEDKEKDNGGDCENYSCHHFLTLALKED